MNRNSFAGICGGPARSEMNKIESMERVHDRWFAGGGSEESPNSAGQGGS
jgi:hypothetical protein